MGKRLIIWHYLCFSLLLNFAFAAPTPKNPDKVIYGDDDRKEINNIDLWKSFANKVAVKIHESQIIFEDDKHVQVQGNKLFENHLEKGRILCEDVAYRDEISIGDCTGFLIGDKLMASAGHCVMAEFLCLESLWVFNFNDKQAINSEGQVLLEKNQVHRCESLIETKTTRWLDFSVFTLEGQPKDAVPLTLNREETKDNAPVVVIGYPEGLAIKIADDAKVIKQDKEHSQFFVTTDSFEGNSGSPIINQRTGLVEGILIGGETDYKENTKKDCYKTNVCKDGKCNGEQVISSSVLLPFLPQKTQSPDNSSCSL